MMSGSRASNGEGTVRKYKGRDGRVRYRASVTHAGHRIDGPVVDRKKDAKPALWEKLRKLASQPDPSGTPFISLGRSWLSGQRLAENTKALSEVALQAYAPFLEGLTPSQVSAGILAAIPARLGVSTSTQARYQREILKILRALGHTVSPPRIQAREPVVRVLTPEEQDRLVNAATWPRTRLALELLLDTGIRAGEACGLMHSDRYLDGVWIQRSRSMVRGKAKTILPKTDASRAWVPLSARLQSQVGPPATGYVLALGETPWNVANLRRAVKAAATSAGIHRLTTKDLRNTAAVNLLAAGVDPATVASITRHSVQTLLQIYYRGSNELKRDALLKVSSHLLGHKSGASVP